VAYLHCVDPVRDTSWDVVLRKPLVSIGRKAGNDIVLDDAGVAAVHANLLRKGRGYSLSAVERSAEIYLNGRPIRQATIADGDRVLIGRFELLLQPGRPEKKADPGAGAPPVDAMSRLVDFSATLMREEKPERLFKKLLEAVVDLTKAEKGFVIVFQDGDRHLAASHNVGDEQLDLSRVSDTIIDQVIRDRRAVIVSDAISDRRYGSAQSVVDLKLSSVMCVPLLYRNDLLGVLYMGNDAITGLFTEKDLALLQVWASQASLAVHAALLLNDLKMSNRNLREQLRRRSQGNIVGSSQKMKQVFRMLRKVSPTDLTVMVLGETGTGKELFARALHANSTRREGPLVKVDCGAIPDTLIENELFGHEAGAFTGAAGKAKGRFEEADGGSLFLDEVGELSTMAQTRLLRVLEDRVVQRLGGGKPTDVDFRLISATHRDLVAMAHAGDFRMDLLQRLKVVRIRLPSLRERGAADIIRLIEHFTELHGRRHNRPVKAIPAATQEALVAYSWPGNVRELSHAVESAVVLTADGVLHLELFELDPPPPRPEEGRSDHPFRGEPTVAELEQRYLEWLMDRYQGRRTEVARVSGLGRTTLWRRLKDMGYE
jgi:DNA-binding NtrC family response regulator